MIVEQCIEDYATAVILGGNHLSSVLVYECFYKHNSSIMTLNAHIDYYPENEISYASLFSYIKPIECTHFIVGICGYKIQNNKQDKIFDLLCSKYLLIELLKTANYLALDVLDPITFGWCASALDKGLWL